MDNNDGSSPTKPPNYGEQSAMIYCGLCIRASFESRDELYQHFQNEHGINQQFREYNVLAASAKGHSQKVRKHRPTFTQNRQHLNEQNSVLNSTKQTVIHPMPNVPVNIEPAVASSSLQNSLPPLYYLQHLNEQNSVLNSTKQTVIHPMPNVPVNIEPSVASSSVQNSLPPLYYLPTSADFIAGFNRPSPPPQYLVYQATNAHTLFNAHALAASLGCVNFGAQSIHPFGTGSVNTAFACRENAMSGPHSINMTDQRQPANVIPSEISRDDITVVNNPTHSI